MSELATVPEPGPSTLALIDAVLKAGVTADNVAVIERLCALREREQAKTAEQDFNRAFAALQSETSGIRATKIVPDKQGNAKYRYAPYEEIMATVRPALERHGFSVSFDMSFSEGRVKAICKLMHTGGHSQTTEFAARIGGGPPGANETQSDGAAMTYAKRFALCNALNIVVEHDTDGDDARGLGATITARQAIDLASRAKTVGADMAKLLKFAGAKSFEEISESRLGELEAMLARKERDKKPATPISTPEDPDADWDAKE